MQEQFSPQESLQLIQSMISKTKADLGENRFYFLLWGWTSFIAIAGQYLLKVVFSYEHHYIIWLLTVVAAVITVMHLRTRSSRERVWTYVGENMSYLWMGLGISFFILSIIFSKMGWQYCYPVYILLYGLGTFVSGRIIKFRPLVVGGIINWALAAASVFFYFDQQMLFAAAAIFSSYIIPGHLLGKAKTT